MDHMRPPQRTASLQNNEHREQAEGEGNDSVKKARVQNESFFENSARGEPDLARQRPKRDRHHEEHGNQGKPISARGAVKPDRDTQKSQCREQLVGRAEEGPKIRPAAGGRLGHEDPGNTHGGERGQDGRRLALLAGQLLKDIAAQAGGNVERIENESGKGHRPEGHGEEQVLLTDHEGQKMPHARSVDGARGALGVGIGQDHDGGERNHGDESLQQHGPVTHGATVALLLDLL